MATVRKDLFLKAVRKAKRVEIRHRSQFDGMIDGRQETGHMLSRAEFLKHYGPGTFHYRIMRIWTDNGQDSPDGSYHVSGGQWGSVYTLDVWIPQEQDQPTEVAIRPRKQPNHEPGRGTLILGTRSYKVEPSEIEGFAYRLTGERGASYVLRRNNDGTLTAWNANNPLGSTPFDGMQFSDDGGLPMVRR